MFFHKADETNFYALRGTDVEYGISKDRVDSVVVSILNTVDSTAEGGITVRNSTYYGGRGTTHFYIPETPHIVGFDDYLLMIRNASSDPMNITGVHLVF